MKRDDEAAYREYVVARLDRLRRTAYLYCRDWYTADDLAAVTISKLYRHWGRARQAGNIDAYVHGILAHVWLDERRRPWRAREAPVAEIADRAGPAEPDGDGGPEVLAMLAGLPPRRRACLVLRFYCDLSVEETAQILGISAGTVKSQTARGLETLRATAKQYTEE